MKVYPSLPVVDDAARVSAICDIFYEAQMLHRAYSEYWEPNMRAKVDWLHNSVLEATLVHLRALVDFFERSRSDKKRAPMPDDVLAEDYGFPAEGVNLPEIVRTHINKRIAHLSYERTRITQSEKHWDLLVIVPPILKRARAFVVHLQKIGHALPSWPLPEELQEFIDQTDRFGT